jgi:hypothetical protein
LKVPEGFHELDATASTPSGIFVNVLLLYRFLLSALDELLQGSFRDLCAPTSGPAAFAPQPFPFQPFNGKL